MRCDDVFIKENQRLNFIFAKIICPARFVSRDPIAPFVNYLEIELWYGTQLRFFSRFLSPNAGLARHGPGDSLLDAVPAAHPDVFRRLENSSQQLRFVEILVGGNFSQHLEHSSEITPHYDSAEDSTGSRILP